MNDEVEICSLRSFVAAQKLDSTENPETPIHELGLIVVAAESMMLELCSDEEYVEECLQKCLEMYRRGQYMEKIEYQVCHLAQLGNYLPILCRFGEYSLNMLMSILDGIKGRRRLLSEEINHYYQAIQDLMDLEPTETYRLFNFDITREQLVVLFLRLVKPAEFEKRRDFITNDLGSPEVQFWYNILTLMCMDDASGPLEITSEQSLSGLQFLFERGGVLPERVTKQLIEDIDHWTPGYQDIAMYNNIDRVLSSSGFPIGGIDTSGVFRRLHRISKDKPVSTDVIEAYYWADLTKLVDIIDFMVRPVPSYSIKQVSAIVDRVPMDTCVKLTGGEILGSPEEKKQLLLQTKDLDVFKILFVDMTLTAEETVVVIDNLMKACIRENRMYIWKSLLPTRPDATWTLFDLFLAGIDRESVTTFLDDNEWIMPSNREYIGRLIDVLREKDSWIPRENWQLIPFAILREVRDSDVPYKAKLGIALVECEVDNDVVFRDWEYNEPDVSFASVIDVIENDALSSEEQTTVRISEDAAKFLIDCVQMTRRRVVISQEFQEPEKLVMIVAGTWYMIHLTNNIRDWRYRNAYVCLDNVIDKMIDYLDNAAEISENVWRGLRAVAIVYHYFVGDGVFDSLSNSIEIIAGCLNRIMVKHNYFSDEKIAWFVMDLVTVNEIAFDDIPMKDRCQVVFASWKLNRSSTELTINNLVGGPILHYEPEEMTSEIFEFICELNMCRTSIKTEMIDAMIQEEMSKPNCGEILTIIKQVKGMPPLESFPKTFTFDFIKEISTLPDFSWKNALPLVLYVVGSYKNVARRLYIREAMNDYGPVGAYNLDREQYRTLLQNSKEHQDMHMEVLRSIYRTVDRFMCLVDDPFEGVEPIESDVFSFVEWLLNRDDWFPVFEVIALLAREFPFLIVELPGLDYSEFTEKILADACLHGRPDDAELILSCLMYHSEFAEFAVPYLFVMLESEDIQKCIIAITVLNMMTNQQDLEHLMSAMMLKYNFIKLASNLLARNDVKITSCVLSMLEVFTYTLSGMKPGCFESAAVIAELDNPFGKFTSTRVKTPDPHRGEIGRAMLSESYVHMYHLDGIPHVEHECICPVTCDETFFNNLPENIKLTVCRKHPRRVPRKLYANDYRMLYQGPVWVAEWATSNGEIFLTAKQQAELNTICNSLGGVPPLDEIDDPEYRLSFYTEEFCESMMKSIACPYLITKENMPLFKNIFIHMVALPKVREVMIRTWKNINWVGHSSTSFTNMCKVMKYILREQSDLDMLYIMAASPSLGRIENDAKTILLKLGAKSPSQWYLNFLLRFVCGCVDRDITNCILLLPMECREKLLPTIEYIMRKRCLRVVEDAETTGEISWTAIRDIVDLIVFMWKCYKNIGSLECPVLSCVSACFKLGMWLRDAEVILGTVGLAASRPRPPQECFTEDRYRELSTFWQFVYEHRDFIAARIKADHISLNSTLCFMKYALILLPLDLKIVCFTQNQAMRFSRGETRIEIRRSRILEDSMMNLLNAVRDIRWLGNIRVMFIGEPGVDAGGLKKEWFTLVTRELLNPDYALFESTTSGRSIQPNPLSSINPTHLNYFRFAGMLFALAIVNNVRIHAHLSMPFLKRILEQEVKIDDCAEVDEDFYKSMMWILDNDVASLPDPIYFTYDVCSMDQHEVVDLIPDGATINVTNENKHEYVKLMVERKMVFNIKEQMDTFITAFWKIIPSKFIQIFTPQELDWLICGEDEIDIADWQRHCQFIGTYNANHPVIERFFRVIAGWEQEDLSKLLMFVTGSNRIPYGGFANVAFTIAPGGSEDRMVTAHTCSNTIDLPEYSNDDTMNERLRYAIEHCEGFGFM